MAEDEDMTSESYMKALEANAQMDQFLDQLLKHAKENPRPQNQQSIDEIIEELKSHPAFIKEVDLTKPLPPEIEALMALKFESEDPEAKAESYKEEGNYHFKRKEYRLAVDNYTEGVKSRAPNKKLNAMLYTNRAAAQFHLGNFHSAHMDCIFACKFLPSHMKAIIRGAQCCQEMQRYEQAISWCDRGLLLFEPENKTLIEIRAKAVQGKKWKDLEVRKQAAKEKKEELEEDKLLTAIKMRGVRLAGVDGRKEKKGLLSLADLQPGGDPSARVHLDQEGMLVWPVLFLYPEHSTDDFIRAFPETHTLFSYISHILGPESEGPPWDEEGKYTPERIQVYFEDREREKLHLVDVNSTLLSVLQHERFLVHQGTPAFILLVEGSKFQRKFLKDRLA